MSSDQRFFDFLKERIGLDVTLGRPGDHRARGAPAQRGVSGADGR